MIETRRKSDDRRKMAFAIIVLTFAYLFMVTFLPLPDTGMEHSKTIVGFLLGSIVGVLVNFYWGSSKKDAAPDPGAGNS